MVAGGDKSTNVEKKLLPLRRNAAFEKEKHNGNRVLPGAQQNTIRFPIDVFSFQSLSRNRMPFHYLYLLHPEWDKEKQLPE
jgi:hypothetical protein